MGRAGGGGRIGSNRTRIALSRTRSRDSKIRAPHPLTRAPTHCVELCLSALRYAVPLSLRSSACPPSRFACRGSPPPPPARLWDADVDADLCPARLKAAKQQNQNMRLVASITVTKQIKPTQHQTTPIEVSFTLIVPPSPGGPSVPTSVRPPPQKKQTQAPWYGSRSRSVTSCPSPTPQRRLK